jgi:hypothetical protein
MPIQPPHAAKPIHHNQTVWYNPTDRRVKIPIHVGSSKINPSGIDLYEVGPKEEVTIPSEYDRAVQVRKNNVIVQGLAPMLQKRGAPPARIHESIDAEAQERKAALEREALASAADNRAAAAAATAEQKARKQADQSAQEAAEPEMKADEGQEPAEAKGETEPEKPPKKPRGRPKGSKNKPKD